MPAGVRSPPTSEEQEMHLAFRGAHFELKGGRGQNIVSYLNGTLTSLRLAVGEPPATTSLGGAWRFYANLGARSASNSPLSMPHDRKTALAIRWRAPPCAVAVAAGKRLL